MRLLTWIDFARRNAHGRRHGLGRMPVSSLRQLDDLRRTGRLVDVLRLPPTPAPFPEAGAAAGRTAEAEPQFAAAVPPRPAALPRPPAAQTPAEVSQDEQLDDEQETAGGRQCNDGHQQRIVIRQSHFGDRLISEVYTEAKTIRNLHCLIVIQRILFSV